VPPFACAPQKTKSIDRLTPCQNLFSSSILYINQLNFYID
jgi:hypothetical protein